MLFSTKGMTAPVKEQEANTSEPWESNYLRIVFLPAGSASHKDMDDNTFLSPQVTNSTILASAQRLEETDLGMIVPSKRSVHDSAFNPNLYSVVRYVDTNGWRVLIFCDTQELGLRVIRHLLTGNYPTYQTAGARIKKGPILLASDGTTLLLSKPETTKLPPLP